MIRTTIELKCEPIKSRFSPTAVPAEAMVIEEVLEDGEIIHRCIKCTCIADPDFGQKESKCFRVCEMKESDKSINASDSTKTTFIGLDSCGYRSKCQYLCDGCGVNVPFRAKKGDDGGINSQDSIETKVQ